MGFDGDDFQMRALDSIIQSLGLKSTFGVI